MYRPLLSIREGTWFKLICGASYQHLPAVRSLALAYTLAGIDCVDVAADPAIISSVWDAFQVAERLVEKACNLGFPYRGRPWLMVSLNDGEDPHFRKATFDSSRCPPGCDRPCERVCPAEAIAFSASPDEPSGVVEERCYGCGRCLPICPLQLIATCSFMRSPDALAPALVSQIDAVEIHTQVGHEAAFSNLWQAIAPFVPHLKLVAISCPDGEGLIDYLHTLYAVIDPLPCVLLWQTDGRPMSGDIGRGTTHAAIHLAQTVLSAHLPGYVQLAGGTNAYTVPKLRQLNLLQSTNLAGVAYGSYARTLLNPVLDALNAASDKGIVHLEDDLELLWQAVERAAGLVSQLKGSAASNSAISNGWPSSFRAEVGFDMSPDEMPLEMTYLERDLP